MTSIPLNFNSPINGLTLNSIRLLFNGRQISLRDAVLSGGGSSYTLQIPASLANLRGGYELRVAPEGLTADLNDTPLLAQLSLFWTKVG